MFAEVIDIFTAPSFSALEQRLIDVGLFSRGVFSPTGMREYYSVEDEEKYGVMGIVIRVVKFDEEEL